jgi:twitching motility protein PilT
MSVQLASMGLFGRLAVQMGILTKEQLAEALRIQGNDPAGRRLGEILTDLEYITHEQINELQRVQIKYREQIEKRELQKNSTAHSPLTKSDKGSAQKKAPPLVYLLKLLEKAWKHSASDLHLQTNATPFIRINGVIRALGTTPLSHDDVMQMLISMMTPDQQAEFTDMGDVDFAWQFQDKIRTRVNSYTTDRGPAACLRLIPFEVPSLQDLNLPNILARCISFHQGLILITGPASSGKTSTVSSLVRLINEDRKHNIITLEDPIEFVHKPILSSILQREVGRHISSFKKGLKGALRQDPDVIVVGELRDIESMTLAISAAETGHLVLATMHTTSAVATVDRLIGAFPSDQHDHIRTLVSETLRTIVVQKLLNRSDGSGRIPAIELVFNNLAISNLIREGRTVQLANAIQLGKSQGMQPMNASMSELVNEGLVTQEEVDRART